MMKMMKTVTFAATMLMALFMNAIQAQDASAILQKLDEVMFSAKDMTATNKIVMVDKNGREESREAVVMQKGNDKRLMRFTAPASQAGIAMLSLPNDVIYLYMPAFGKERRISSSVKNQNFAGTDFSYDDLQAQPFSDKYTGKVVKTTADAYHLELTPKGNSDYSKMMAVVHKTEYYPVSTEFYDKAGNKVKEAKYTFKKVGKYWSPVEIEMKDLRKGRVTRMIMENPQYDKGLSDDEFTVRKLIN